MDWPIKRVYRNPSVWNNRLMTRSLDDLFEDFFGDFDIERRPAILAPRIEVSENEKDFVLEAELPGMDEKDVKLTIENDILTIEGERSQTKEDKKLHHSERSYGTFRRSLRLDDAIDSENVKASFKNGVLTVTLPKSKPEKRKARTIDIQAA